MLQASSKRTECRGSPQTGAGRSVEARSGRLCGFHLPKWVDGDSVGAGTKMDEDVSQQKVGTSRPAGRRSGSQHGSLEGKDEHRTQEEEDRGVQSPVRSLLLG